VELDALAELDLPGRRSHELRHLGRERGDDLEALVPLVERVEDVATQVRWGVSDWFIMSSVVGSTPWAMTTLPAGAAAAPSGTRKMRARTARVR